QRRVAHYYQIIGDVNSGSFHQQLRQTLDLAKQTATALAIALHHTKEVLLFISYSHRNRDLASELALRLADESYSIWIDDERLRAGTLWYEGVDYGLGVSDGLILLLSPSAVESAQVQKEYETFLVRGKPIIPVLIEPIGSLPSPLAPIHYVD